MKRIITFVPLLFMGTILGFAQTAPDGGAYREEGIASWYGEEFQGRQTASGEIFDPNDFTAAHPTLQYGTILTITNRVNNKQVQVRINDRGPFVPTRIIDVSRAAAEKLDMIQAGTAEVIIEMTPRPYPSMGTAPGGVEGDPAAALREAAPREFAPPSDYLGRQPQDVSRPLPQDGSPAPAPSQAVSASGIVPRQAAPAGPPSQTASASGIVPRQAAPAAPPSQAASASGIVPRPSAPITMTPAGSRAPASAAPAYAPQLPPSAAVRPVTQTPPPQTPPPASALQSQSLRQPAPAQTPGAPAVQTPVPATAPLPQSAPLGTAPRQAAAPVIMPQTSLPPGAPAPAARDAAPAPQTAPSPSAATQTQLPPSTILGGPIIQGRVYRIQVGAFKEASNAMKTYNKLISSGFNPQWERYEGYFRVVLTGVRSEDIPVIASKLGGAGFTEAVARLEGVDVRE